MTTTHLDVPARSIEPVARLFDRLPPSVAAEHAAFVEAAPCASHLQRPDWPERCSAHARHRHLFAEIRRDERLIATAVVRLTTLAPGRRLASLRRGPVTRSLDDLDAALGPLMRALAKTGVCTAILHPRWEGEAARAARDVLSGRGGEVLPAADQSLHTATALVDLSGDAAALSARLKQRARRQIKKAAKMGVEVRPAASLDEARRYAPILEAFHAERGLSLEAIPPVEEQWRMTREKGAFLLAYRDGVLIGGHTAIAVGDRAFWLTLASIETDASVPKNYPLLGEALRLCQAQGLTAYDMAGAPSPDAAAADAVSDAEKSRFAFKAAFAPQRVDLVPAMVFALQRPAHDLLFSLRSQYRRWKRRGR